MKLSNYYLLACLFISSNVAAQNVSYPTYDGYMKSLRGAGDSIMNARKSLLPGEVTEQLALAPTKPFSLPVNSKKADELPDNEIYKKIKPAVLIIGMVYRSPVDTASQVNQASGYVIDPSGICVTNYHVMLAYSHAPSGGKYAFVAQNGLGKSFGISKVLYASIENDLAVFQLDLGSVKALPFLSLANNDAKIGDPVYVLGHPQGMFYFFSKGIVSDKYSDHLMLINNKGYTNRNTMTITADFGTGSSGGPILDDKGNVIATVSSTRTVSQDAMGRSVPQMVIKNTIPVSSLKALLSKKQ
jgi:serine protease Do